MFVGLLFVAVAGGASGEPTGTGSDPLLLEYSDYYYDLYYGDYDNYDAPSEISSSPLWRSADNMKVSYLWYKKNQQQKSTKHRQPLLTRG